ncbi:hypothetical protein BHM03_00033099 [Ensete ventricosum]|nr:hypothetical protein B296_00004189 [Ensete ventricosum]RZR74177.1 hypothetical protein BHM03_00033099 [Ensete ventricosum]
MDDKPASADQEDASTKNSVAEEHSKDKAVKKPDKILPCPRCKSLDTKFCYYNNYNVNQPRHFCKNCQRYWTAGGTMRNVPVGAGRRKSKSSSHFRHIAVSESSLQSVRCNAPEPVHYPPPKPNGTVLSFGADAPAKTKPLPSSENETGGQNPPIPCFGGSPWPYPWTPAAPLSFPIPFYPAAAYWSCAVPSGAWSIPWLAPLAPSHPATAAASNTGNSGKHSRDGSSLPREEDGGFAPTTLRIDDPEEAARSSIWTMVGVKHSKNNAVVSNGGLLRAFHPKVDVKNHALETPSPPLHANPAALSRSLNFHETS